MFCYGKMSHVLTMNPTLPPPPLPSQRALLSLVYSISQFPNHAQSQVRVFLVVTVPDYSSPIIYSLSEIVDLFTFELQSAIFYRSPYPSAER